LAKHIDGRPRHQQIAADLRAKILSGDLAPDAQIPSTQQLVAHYSASNATIQRALTVLKDEGFISSQVGKGVYVRSKQPLVVEASAYIQPTPGGFTYQLLEVAEVHPPAEVRVALKLAEDETAVVRRRLLTHRGDPVELSWSYYPSLIARGTSLAAARKIAGGASGVLSELGYPQREFVDMLSARLPTTEEVEALELPDDVPVIRQFRVIYSDLSTPVEVTVMIKGGHLYELLYRHTISAKANTATS
jgi:GntR family transcriptional regulator